MKKKMDKVTKWIKTKQDWYPSYLPKEYENPLDHKALRVSRMELSDGTYRVCVWGADDFGLEYDSQSAMKVKELYNKITDFTAESTLRLWGFVTA